MVHPLSIWGGKPREIELETGQKFWAFGSKQYIEAAVNNVVEYLRKRNQVLAVKAETSLTSNYRPEVDVSEELGPQEAYYYHSLIAILRWIVELGRVNINCKVSMMS